MKIGLLLNRCTAHDDVETHEVSLCLLALEESGVDVAIITSNIAQDYVIDHIQDTSIDDLARPGFVESAHGAQGAPLPFTEQELMSLDGVLITRSFERAHKPHTLSSSGTDHDTEFSTERLLNAIQELNIPLGLICVSPALIAHVSGVDKLTRDTTDHSTELGASALNADDASCIRSSVVVDEERALVFIPADLSAHLTDISLTERRHCIKLMVDQVIAWATPIELRQSLRALEGWSIRSGALYKRWNHQDCASALHFAEQIGVCAEELNHHPDLTLGWGYVTVSLMTHDASQITALDFALARRIDGLK